VENKKQI